jgi:poly-gamma-glutamate capsule biosynthesis protein CapA/YwtB (metallophosphatase superfamily)
MSLPRTGFILFIYIVLFPPLLLCQSFAEEKSFTIVGVGDIMPGTDYPSGKYLPPGDVCHHLMESVIPFLRDADITFGNLEGSFAGSAAQAKICHDTLNCYVFRIPERFVSCLVEAGFDMMSLANNHSGDFGQEGRDNTRKVLDDAGIAYAGLIECPFTVIVRDSIRFGLCAFAPNPGTCSITDIKSAAEIVKELEKKCDVVIVSFHGGAEGRDFQHVPGNMETYLGQNRGNVYEFSHAMIDAGGDILFGHGPHVSRAIEIYKERLICYSLGNFCTYGRFNLQGPNGIAPLMKVDIDRNGKFLQGEIIPIKQAGRGITEPDPEKQAIRKIRELTRADFPEAPVEITDEGGIFYKIKDKR